MRGSIAHDYVAERPAIDRVARDKARAFLSSPVASAFRRTSDPPFITLDAIPDNLSTTPIVGDADTAAVFALLNSPSGFPLSPQATPTGLPQLGTPLLRAESPTPSPAPEPGPPPEEYVRVANTAGQGLTLRREPSVSAARLAARAENTILRVVGPDETVDGRVWRQVEDSQGVRGWAPAEFLEPASAPGG